jgi:hypothetical protein
MKKIYRIFSLIGGVCYIGQTGNKYISRRLSQHVYNKRNSLCYCSSFEVLQYSDYKIELIDECEDKDVNTLENKYIHFFQNSVNLKK